MSSSGVNHSFNERTSLQEHAQQIMSNSAMLMYQQTGAIPYYTSADNLVTSAEPYIVKSLQDNSGPGNTFGSDLKNSYRSRQLQTIQRISPIISYTI